MWLSILIIHVVELTLIGIFLLIRRNNALEKTIIKQQQYIDAINIIVSNSNEKLKELDVTGAFRADDEVGVFFQNLNEIQNILNDFNKI